jgi:minichromosome maintenance protein 10
MSRGGALAGSDEEEDEETLQLKLQQIEAKLKLKALQRKKDAGSADNDRSGASSRAGTAMGVRKFDLPRPEPRREADVEEAQEARSPARVILGIDKGLTARDVSLKRPGSSMTSGLSRSASSREPPKIKSFSERIAESRTKEKVREEKQEKAEERRSRGFGLHNIEGLKDRPSLSRTSSSQSADTRTSRDMPPPPPRSPIKGHSRSKSDVGNAPTPRPGSTLSFRPESSRPPSSMSKSTSSSFGGTPTSTKYAEISSRDDSTDGPGFEPFSGLHLKSREMQHNVVTRTLEGKTVLTPIVEDR